MDVLSSTADRHERLILTMDVYDRSTWPAALKHIDNVSEEFIGPIKSKTLLNRGSNSTQQLLDKHPRTQHPRPLPSSHVSVREYLASGRTMAAFAATANGVPLVAKFGFPTETSVTYKEAGQEAYIYHHFLKPLQGTVVPTSYGLWVSHQLRSNAARFTYVHYTEVLCILLEDVGSPLTNDAIDRLTVGEKNVIINKYRQLHAAGVVHKSPAPKHWLRHGRLPIDTVRIVDFGLSIYRKSNATAQETITFKAEVAAEIDAVCKLLKLDKVNLQLPSRTSVADGTSHTPTRSSVSADCDDLETASNAAASGSNSAGPAAKKRRVK